MKFKKLTTHDFSKLLGDDIKTISSFCGNEIKKNKLEFRSLTLKEKEAVILKILKKINSVDLPVSGPENKKRWERGWQENLENFKKSNYNLSELTPKFIRSKQPIRLWGDYALTKQHDFELRFYNIFRAYIFHKYLSGVNCVYEFGCGTGFNLVELAKIYPRLQMHGLDWAPQSKKIIDLIRKKYKINIHGHVFDMFNTDSNFALERKSAILAIGALEQLGENFKKFIRYLISQKPDIVVHVDSIDALYNENNLSDYLAILHDKKRNYLRGYLNYMKSLEKERKIKFIKIQKVSCGGLYHDGYSFDVWKISK